MSGDEQDQAEPEDQPKPRPRSEFEEGVQHFGNVLGGVMTRLLGERVTGQAIDPHKPLLGPNADLAIDKLGDTMGRLLNAAGRGLSAHPDRPVQALDETVRLANEPVETEEGVAPLTEGLRSLANGLYKTTEAVLDRVAPRKPKTSEAHEE
jgi:hypothetical protein